MNWTVPEQYKEHRLCLSIVLIPWQLGKILSLPGSPFLLSKMKIIRGSWWGLNEVMYVERSFRRIQNVWAQERFGCSINASSHFFYFLIIFLPVFLFISLSLYLMFPCTINSVMKHENGFAPDRRKTGPSLVDLSPSSLTFVLLMLVPELAPGGPSISYC